ncbi:threonine/serine exporter family protein [Paenibacillus glycanilyticus]|uniref:Membrane protein n=1 Tax=Paenibacillus glycanilyticus TaxID=126569 RepID=A0ABQ6GIA7_9BACL|nr:threonine/serine exporter family protein [Paenibacillus glycanilyticus]GLX69995.1 membrane protein [Paenibacillus glycanilyticus]
MTSTVAEQPLNSYHLIAQTCLLAGKIILQNGGETYRVEDTMVRIAAAYGVSDAQSYVTPTGILFAMDASIPTTRLIRISERSVNLRKVSLVNDISRRISEGKLDVNEAHRLLVEIDEHSFAYPVWLQVLVAALASGCFLVMFGGRWHDFTAAFCSGGLGFMSVVMLHRLVPVKLFAEFVASLILGGAAILFVKSGIAMDKDLVIIASVMPLVPGLHITNAVRDLMAGHLVSGLSKGVEAFLTAFAIGAGMAAALSFY